MRSRHAGLKFLKDRLMSAVPVVLSSEYAQISAKGNQENFAKR